MAYFARKLRYGANDGENGATFMAFIELAKKKGGKPFAFMLYLYRVRYSDPVEHSVTMIRFKAETAEEAIRRFWPWDEGTGKEFPGWESDRWEKTTLWLYPVAVGGSYERYEIGAWARVPTPNPWAKRHKKKPLQFGNLSHVYLIQQKRLDALVEEKRELEYEIRNLNSLDYDSGREYLAEEDEAEYAQMSAELEELEEQVNLREAEMRATLQEIRDKVYRMFPGPAGLTPRRVLRQRASEGRRMPM